MKAYAKILGVVLVGLAIQLALAAGEKGVGDSLVSRAFTVVSNINSLVSRAFTVSSNTDSLVSRAFTVTSNTDSLVSRAFTVTSNTDSLVSRAFTAVNCEDGDGGLCPDCDDNGIPDQCELDCGEADGPCDIEGCGLSDDCNGNGVPDECEILDCTGEPECSDCNENGIPDGCEPDCNDNTVPDDCDIDPEDPDENGEVSNDCNENGIPDECEPDCRGDGIPDECEITGCGGDPECSDCNGNGIPDGCDLDSNDPDGNGEVSGDCDDDGVLDECEIADCDGSPECGDCNVNGIPDGCDIDSGFSQDVEPPPDGDDVPDECVVWAGGAEGDSWSTDGNWQGNDAPGNGNPDDLESVVIAVVGANVFLDIDVSIDSLLLGAGATLHIDHEGELGDMIVESGGAILAEGDLLVAHDRLINATGSSVTIGPGGVYQADPAAKELISATLIAGSVTVLEGPEADGGGGVMSLTDGMVLMVEGNLSLDGLNAGGGFALGGEGDCVGDVLHVAARPAPLRDVFVQQDRVPVVRHAPGVSEKAVLVVSRTVNCR
ncbi:MAG: hypothetical protein IIA44_14455, partial [Acidobacteria bacterium]|nr:hypothetical protein [Acidobacteriota bacterium]